MNSAMPVERVTPARQIHIIGAGPVGLFLAALLQPVEGMKIRLYEKRPDYQRTRMVRLASHLRADTDSHADTIDSDNIDAVFEPHELETKLAFKKSVPADLMSQLSEWTQGFCPLNTIERSLSRLIDERRSGSVERIATTLSVDDALAIEAAGDIIIDCSGCNSLLRDHLLPAAPDDTGFTNTVNLRLEYAVVVTFLYGQPYACNEYCKYYKNIDNPRYKFIPAFDRTFYDGSISHVTGIINITAEDYDRMPKKFDGQWLREHFPAVSNSMDRFIGKIREETGGELVGDLELLRIPLNLYHARNYTSRRWLHTDHPFARTPVFLTGDSAIGSPYFQSISLGFECAMHLASLLAQPDLPLETMLDRYELFGYKQWLRVYMRSKLIKHNKDIFERIDDRFAILEQLHIY